MYSSDWTGFPYEDFLQFAFQSLADQVKMLQADPVSDFIIIVADGGWPDPRSTGEISLRPALFA